MDTTSTRSVVNSEGDNSCTISTPVEVTFSSTSCPSTCVPPTEIGDTLQLMSSGKIFVGLSCFVQWHNLYRGEYSLKSGYNKI